MSPKDHSQSERPDIRESDNRHMDIDFLKSELFNWLAQMELPKDSPASSWEECVKTFPSPSDSGSAETGLRLRISLQLNTSGNKYLISFLESMEPDSRGIYILAVHVNWKDCERSMQQMVECGYKGRFNDILRSTHVIWIQTFLANELKIAMDSAAIAILSHELTGTPAALHRGHPVRRPTADRIDFPSEPALNVDDASGE
ncbi:MAG: hypothetical protein P1R58_08875 [bacterium]|nr:hypothetical protein [bacterium]